MRAIIQRVTRAAVSVETKPIGAIENGLVILLGITHDDGQAEIDYLVEKIVNLRIFDEAEGKMNLSLKDTGGGALVISQFTLYGDTRRGRRPSWMDAAPPAIAEPLYEQFVTTLRAHVAQVETGVFRAMMNVELINAGPVTLILDSRKS